MLKKEVNDLFYSEFSQKVERLIIVSSIFCTPQNQKIKSAFYKRLYKFKQQIKT